MNTFEQFQKSAEVKPAEDQAIAKYIYRYQLAPDFYGEIFIYDGATFGLVLDRDEWETKNLQELERRLYDWMIAEYESVHPNLPVHAALSVNLSLCRWDPHELADALEELAKRLRDAGYLPEGFPLKYGPLEVGQLTFDKEPEATAKDLREMLGEIAKDLTELINHSSSDSDNPNSVYLSGYFDRSLIDEAHKAGKERSR